MIIDDNFLTDEEISNYQNIFYKKSKNLPWKYSDGQVEIVESYEPDIVNKSVLTKNKVSSRIRVSDPTYHSIRAVTGGNSSHYLANDAIEIFLKFAEKNGIVVNSIDAVNINMKTASKSSGYSTHIDKTSSHSIFLYYVNDAEGDTTLFNEVYSGSPPGSFTVKEKVSPKAGRGMVFNGLNYHSASGPESQGFRCVININFNSV